MFPSMPELVEWIREKLEQDPERTQSGLADYLGVHKSVVNRMLSGHRQIKATEITKISGYFGAMPPLGFAEEEAPYVGPKNDAVLAPVFAATTASKSFWNLHRHMEPIDRRRRAPDFENASKVFCFYAPDNAAAPRFKAREPVWIDPVNPAKPGEDALFVKDIQGDTADVIVLGELQARNDVEFTFTQYREGTEGKLNARLWKALRVISRY